MKLFLISQTEHDDYDTYDSAVVAAPDEEIARDMNPGCIGFNKESFSVKAKIDWNDAETLSPYSHWCYKRENVKVRYLGEAAEGIQQDVICASFNAG